MANTQCHCGISFELTERDIAFYQKMNVPEPKLCPDCRQIRRLAFRNEHKLYHNHCALCEKPIISIYSPDKSDTVYCAECWWGDSWDPFSYGKEFDFSRPFFEQWAELWQAVPKITLIILGDNLNSDFTHDNYRLKNCYLVFDGEQGEDCYYGETFVRTKNCIDFLNIDKCELCYECVNCVNCYDLRSSRFCQNCSNSAFLVDCVGCRNCIGCVNLHQKEFHIFNQPYSAEEFQAKKEEFQLHDFSARAAFQEQFEAFALTLPKRSYRGVQNENVTGDNISESKDTFDSYDVAGLRDCRFCTNILVGANDCYDYDIWGDNASLVYNSAGVGNGVENIVGCYYCFVAVSNIYHSAFCCKSSHDLLGCIGLIHKEFCILNKQYSEEEYRELFPKIVEHMNATGEWGEFFPSKLSPFGYNETVAQIYYPLSKDVARGQGFNWKDKDLKDYQPQSYQTPTDIDDVPDAITKELLACEACSKNYRIIPQELAFYRKQRIPAPKRCFDCRHLGRFMLRNPRKLFEQPCAHCNRSVSTPYAPSRPEQLLCEQCYQQAVF